MFFVLSKALSYFLFPLTWVLVFIILALIFKRKQRFLLVIATVIFLVFSNPFLFSKVMHAWDAEKVKIPKGNQYSCAILLGGFINMDKQGKGYFNGSSDRFIQALKLYQQGKVKKILVTGGSGTVKSVPFKYSTWVGQQLEKCGVKHEDILIEDESRNTLENAEFSKRVLDSAGLKPPYVLVTSAYHMRRAAWVFRNEQMNVIPYPCNYISRDVPLTLQSVLPGAATLDLWVLYTKEMIGYNVYRLKATVK